MGCGGSVESPSHQELRDGDNTGENRLDMLTDEQLDVLIANVRAKLPNELHRSTKILWALVEQTHSTADPIPIEKICLPKEKLELKYLTFERLPGIALPDDDEDWPQRGFLEKRISGFVYTSFPKFVESMPWYDESPVWFDSVEEGIVTYQMTVADIMPKAVEIFDDLVSDSAMSLIAFWGLGQLHLKGRVPPAKGWEVDLTSLHALEVRPAFERLGANAIFGADGVIERIYWSHGAKDVYPGEKDWEHAKWAWKASLFGAAFVVFHATVVHWTIANTTHVACRTQLGENHPIRRVLKVFTFNTGSINFFSAITIAPLNSYTHRLSPFTYDGFVAAVRGTTDSWRYQTHPDFIASKNLGEMTERVPIAADGLKVWRVFHKFFSAYVALFYRDDAAVAADTQLVAYWQCVETRGGQNASAPYGLPSLGLAALIDHLTEFAFQVTAMHEFVGHVTQYITTPVGLGLQVRPGFEVMDWNQFTCLLLQAAVTGKTQPSLLGDWSHLLPSDPQSARDLYTQLMADLWQVSAEIDKLNATAPSPARARKCESFNPKYFECSVSV